MRDGKFWDKVDPCMGTYPRKGVEAMLELALACVEPDQEKRPQMIELTRDLETIMRDTVAPESPGSFWLGRGGDSSNGSSFSTWSSGKKLSAANIHSMSSPGSSLANATDVETSWASTDGLILRDHPGSLARDVTIEMEPR